MQIERNAGKRSIDIYFALIFLLVLMVVGIFLPKGARSLVIQMMVFSILAMGYDLCLGFTNQCSLGHSVFFGGGAYGAVFAILHLKMGILPSLFFSMVAGFILAAITGFISVRLSEAYFVIITAIFFAVFHLLAMDMTWLTGGDDGLSIQLPTIDLGFTKLSLYNQMVNYYFVLIFLLASYLILSRIAQSPMGKIFVSIRENEKRVQFLGYNIFRYKLIAFILSGMFTALSGGLYALTLRYASADFFSFSWSIMPVVWCLIGGLGTFVGSWIGVVLMSIFQYYVSAWWTYYLILFGIIILLILRISRKGILGYVISRRLT
ncbi:MAG: branched-chain amino acid ABC transporter permease [Thermodesulfobacteriota bacterium]